MIRYRALTMLAGCLVLLTILVGCGGGGGSSAPGGTPTPVPPSPPDPTPPQPGSTTRVTGRAHAGTPARPLSQSPCRFVAMDSGRMLAEAATDRAGVFVLDIPLDQQGFMLCHPPVLSGLELSAFISTVGQPEGGRLAHEDVTPASSVIADVIRANDPLDPQARKEELMAALARGEPEITALVDAATLLYQTVFDAQVESDANFAGDSAEDGGDTDGGGVEGEAGDGGEFSPLPGALCSFSLDAAGLVRIDTLMGDLYADGQVDRLDLQLVAAQINQAIDAERRRAITRAFATLFPLGIGPSLATIADGADSQTPGRYFLPIPKGVPGVVTCIPDMLDNLVLRTCVRARAPNEVITAEDVTPISTVVCEIANEAQQSGTEADRDTTVIDLFDRLAPLRIFLSEDRNANGVQDPDEQDKNDDGEFATIVELESDEPLTDTSRDLALLASMSTTIFDTLRIEIDDLERNPSFERARNDFFADGEFDDPFEPIALGVERALNDPDNQAVLGTDDVVTAAGTGTLQGRVTDVQGRPVGDVRVVVSQGDVEVAVPDNPAITDADGGFQIRDIPVGDTTVRAFLGEFEVLRVTTNVVAVVTITLEIAPAPQLASRPASLVYNDVEVGAARVLTVRLINQGLADLTLNGLSIEGADASAFRFRRRPMLPVVVAAGSEVTVDIGFEPSEPDAALATLRVESDATNAPVLEVPLIGMGVERPVPQIELSRTRFAFGEVQLNAFRTQTMVVSNSGTAPLTIRAVAIVATAGAGFVLERGPSLPAVLPPDGELALRVRYQPTQIGVSRGLVSIQSDANEAPSRTVALSGTGVEAPVPEITANPSVLEFGDAQINVPGEDESLVTRTVTLLNTGTADLTLTAVRVDSSQGNEFRLFRPPDLPLTIVPGGGLELVIQYRPTLIGSVTGAVRIGSDAVNVDDLTIPINGTGVDTRVPRIAVSRSTLDYGEVEIGATRQLSFDVTNTGTGDLEIERLALQSPGDQVFQLNRPPETPFTLVPGATQRLRVRFQPDEEGYVTGALRIHNNDTERPRRRIALRGEGVQAPIPQMVVSPEVGSFGDVQVGSSRSLVVTISNPGLAELEVTAFEGSVLSGGEFELRRPPRLPVPVRPEAEVDIEVVFRPQEEGLVTGTLRIRGTAPDAPSVTIPLYGTATPEPSPRMQVSPRTLDYGEVQERTSQTETVTIRNNGTADLVIRELSITDRSSPDFEIDRAPQLPVTVIPGSNAQVRVRYSPSAPGVASGVLRITGNDLDQPVATVSLSGIGTAEPIPQISVTPSMLAFGEVQENQSRRLTLTVRNSGTATLRLDDLIVDGAAFYLPDADDFPIPIRTQSVLRLDVVYEPTEPGSDSGTLRIENNSPETPEVVVALSGYAVPEPQSRIEVEPLQIDFADVQIGARRRLPVRIFNTGTAPLNVTALRVDGGPSGTFTLDGNPAPVTVVAGGSIQVFVNFAPVEEGSVTGTFEVESDADNADEISVPLSGTGFPEPLPQIDVAPMIVEFREVEIGASRVERITIRNQGTDDLIVTALDIDGGDDNAFQVRRAPTLPVTVLPEGEIQVRLAYAPATTGSATGTLTIASNDPETPAVIVSLSGVGTPMPTPQVAASTDALSFPEVEVGRTRERDLIITNVGNATLTIRDINLTSEPEGVFVLSEALSTAGTSIDEIALPPQAEVPIGVVFAPASVGLVTGTLQLISDAVNADVLTVTLDGVGTEAPMPSLIVSPAAVDFGALAIGRTRTLTVNMRNEGTAPLTIEDLELVAADGVSFELGAIPELPAVVPPNTAVTAEIRFVPDTEGSATGTFRIASDDPDDPETILSVTGESLPEPVARLAVSPSPVRFGNVPVGTTEALTLSLANEGNANLNVTELIVNGGPNNVFRLGGGRQAPFTVAPGEVETVNIVFAPIAAGLVTGTIDIQSNARNADEAIVSLRGTGTASEITLSPDTLNFGGVPVGSSRTLEVTAVNNGSAALEIAAITIEGAGFSLSAVNTPVTLQPTDALTFDVTYRPSDQGAASGVVRVSNNSVEDPQAEVRLRGTGTVPEIEVDPDAVDFGGVELEQSEVVSITITNEGEADLDITSVTAEGDGFSVRDVPQETTPLEPGETLTVDIVFAPLELGEANGALQIASNDPASPTRVPLRGEGLPMPVEIDVTPDALEFGSVLLGGSAEMELTIANPGESVLSVSEVRLREGVDAGFSLSEAFSDPVEVVSGGEVTVAIAFTPVEAGEVNGTLEIVSNADEGTVRVPLRGTGELEPTPRLVVEPEAIDYGEVTVNDTQTQELTLRNEGDGPLIIETIELTSGGGAGFALVDGPNDAFEIVPGGAFGVEVRFTPDEEGQVEGTIDITSNADNAPSLEVPLRGEGVSEPMALIEVEPSEDIDFGNVEVDQRRSVTVTISNRGDADLTLDRVFVPEGSDSGFALDGGALADEVLEPDERLEVELTFTPIDEGLVTGLFRVESNASNESEVERSLRGRGTAIPVPVVTVNPDRIDFDSVDVGDEARAELAIENTGDADLTIEEVLIVEGESSGFGVRDVPDGSTVLEPGEVLRVTVVFAPESSGEVTGLLSVRSDASNEPDQRVRLQGEGREPEVPSIEVTPSILDFGEVRLDSDQTSDIEIENTGNVPATVTDIEVVEGRDAGFALQNAFNNELVLEPGDSATVTVVYAPMELGDAGGLLRIESDAGDVDVMLIGAGMAVPVSITVSPEELLYGAVQLGESRELDLTIRNPGDGVLRVSNIRVREGADAGFSLSEAFSDPVEVVSGGEVTVAIAFTPVEAGEVNGTLEIVSNADEGTVRVPLRGTGELEPTPRLVVEPEAIDYGEVTVNDTQTQELTLRNEGDGPLIIETIELTSGGGAGFALVDGPNDAFEIVPGGAFGVEVRFTPDEEGQVEGTIDITSNADNAPSLEVPLRGEGVSEPMALIEVEPSEDIDFGNVEVDQRRSVTVTISNRGDADLTLDRVFVPEGSDSGFALDGGALADEVLEPDERLEVELTFTPIDEGLVTGLFRVESNASNESEVERSLRGRGTAIPVPVVTVNPDRIDFDSVDVGDEARAELAIENTGDADLTIEEVLIVEGESSGFGVRDVPDGSTVLEPGEVLRVTVVFAPESSGEVTGLLSVRSDASNEPDQRVRLQGAGVEPAAPSIEVVPGELAFGAVPVGDDEVLSLTIRNPGDALLEVEVELVTEAPAGVFTLENVPSEVSASDEVSLRLRFRPSRVGEVRGEVRITSNAEPDAITVDVTGTGQGSPELTLSRSSVDFGDVFVGESSTETVRLENTGTDTLVLDDAEIAGDADFTLETGLGDGELEPGETLTLEITYQPAEMGESEGNLEITGNVEAQSVSLRGNGVLAPEPRIEVTPGSVDFGDVEIGETEEAEITIENTGDAVLRITEIALTGNSDEDFDLPGGVTDTVEVAPGDELVVTVRFTPTSASDASGGVRIASNAANDRTVVIDLEGTGVPRPEPEISVAPTEIDFGNIRVGDRDTANVRIENTGTSDLNVDPLVIRGDDGFEVDRDNAGAFTLEPGEDVVVTISFSPDQTGEADASLEISSNANERPDIVVELRGEGVAARIDVQPANLEFEPQEIGQSQSLTIDVTNEGTAELDLTRVSIDEPSFELGDVPASVAPGATETIEVTFRPDRQDDIVGALTIENNSENEPEVVVRLSGMGTMPAGAGLFVGETSLAFGDTRIDEPASLLLALISVGLTDVTLSRLELGVAGDFILGERPALPLTLAPGEAVIIEVVFAPNVQGLFSDQLQIVSDDENDPVTHVSLNGVGVEASAALDGPPQ